jgi:uncharacterized protein YdiU (UPF0061 family)
LQREQLGRWRLAYQQLRADDGDLSFMPAHKRLEQMRRTNPKFILRNYMAQLAIEQAEAGDLSLVHELQRLLRAPYDDQPGQERWAAKRPDWAANKPGCSMLSCSS